MPLTVDSTIKLRSGNLMPRLALGVYRSSGKECENAIQEAIKAGYRSSG
jgi:diketogulonate reductase-like aldo/keto reductase